MLDFAKIFLNYSLCFVVGGVVITLCTMMLLIVSNLLCSIYGTIMAARHNKKMAAKVSELLIKKAVDAPLKDVLDILRKEAN